MADDIHFVSQHATRAFTRSNYRAAIKQHCITRPRRHFSFSCSLPLNPARRPLPQLSFATFPPNSQTNPNNSQPWHSPNPRPSPPRPEGPEQSSPPLVARAPPKPEIVHAQTPRPSRLAPSTTKLPQSSLDHLVVLNPHSSPPGQAGRGRPSRSRQIRCIAAACVKPRDRDWTRLRHSQLRVPPPVRRRLQGVVVVVVVVQWGGCRVHCRRVRCIRRGGGCARRERLGWGLEWGWEWGIGLPGLGRGFRAWKGCRCHCRRGG